MTSPGPIDVRKQNEDDSMRTASEVVQHLNETRCNEFPAPGAQTILTIHHNS